jgi:hypothetical protein
LTKRAGHGVDHLSLSSVRVIDGECREVKRATALRVPWGVFCLGRSASSGVG